MSRRVGMTVGQTEICAALHVPNAPTKTEAIGQKLARASLFF